MKKHLKSLLFLALFSLLSVFSAVKVNADSAESTFKDYVSSLDSNSYALYLPTGGFITNKDGSNDFSKKQIEDTAGEVIKVEELKEVVNSDIKVNNLPILRGPSQPSHGMALAAGQTYTSQAFSGSGWRYGGYWIAPDYNTGAYLLWTSYGDSAFVGPQHEVYSHTGTTLYPGQPKYIVSDINRGTSFWGVCYLTFNPANGSYYTVYNG